MPIIVLGENYNNNLKNPCNNIHKSWFNGLTQLPLPVLAHGAISY